MTAAVKVSSRYNCKAITVQLYPLKASLLGHQPEYSRRIQDKVMKKGYRQAPILVLIFYCW